MLKRFTFAILLAGAFLGSAWAGEIDGGLLPPGSVGTADDGRFIMAQDSSVADLVARVQRLEGSNRQLNGRVDELTNLVKRLQTDFAKYREDTEFRLQAVEGAGAPAPKKKAEAPIAKPADPALAAADQPKLGTPAADLGTLAADPTAQGGTDPALAGNDSPMENDPNQPLDLATLSRNAAAEGAAANGGAGTAAAGGGAQTGLLPPGLPGVAVDTSQPIIASAPTNSPKDEFDLAYGFLQRKDYEVAELSLRKFIAGHPNDALVPDATYWLGESLYQRKQYRDAAESFLKVTTDYAKSKRAPSGMLRLGMALSALGEREAACATFQEIGKKYPAASETVKAGVVRETTRAKC